MVFLISNLARLIHERPPMIAQEFDSQRDLTKESRTRVIRATEEDSFADQRTSERGSRFVNNPG